MTTPWWGDDPAAFSDERVIADPEPSAAEWGKQFCESCGFAWSVHDNSDPLTTVPFGCPTEVTARLRWGR